MYFDGYKHPHLKRVALLSLTLLLQEGIYRTTENIIDQAFQSTPKTDFYHELALWASFFPILLPIFAPAIIRKLSLRYTTALSNIGYLIFNIFGVLMTYHTTNPDGISLAVIQGLLVPFTCLCEVFRMLFLICILHYAFLTSPTEERGNFLGVILGFFGLNYVLYGFLLLIARELLSNLLTLTASITAVSALIIFLLCWFPDPVPVKQFRETPTDTLELEGSFSASLQIWKKLLTMKNFQKICILMGFTGALVTSYYFLYQIELFSPKLLRSEETIWYVFLVGGFQAFGAFLNGYLIDLNSKIVSFRIGFVVFSIGVITEVVYYFTESVFLDYFQLAFWGFSDTAGAVIALAFVGHEFEGKLEGICSFSLFHQIMYCLFSLITKYWGNALGVVLVLWVAGLITLIMVNNFDLMVIFEDEYYGGTQSNNDSIRNDTGAADRLHSEDSQADRAISLQNTLMGKEA